MIDTFEVISLVETIEFGFAVREINLGTYFGEHHEGYSYQISQSASSNDGLWNGSNNTRYGERGF